MSNYPFDPTGTDPGNRVDDEPHTALGPGGRVIVPLNGPVYADSVTVTTTIGGTPLTRGSDYKLLFNPPDAIEDTGQEVVSLIYIHNLSIVGDKYITYQVVGGTKYNDYFPSISAATLDQIDLATISQFVEDLAVVVAQNENSIGVLSQWLSVLQSSSRLFPNIAGGVDSNNAVVLDDIKFFTPDNTSGATYYQLPENPTDGQSVYWGRPVVDFDVNNVVILTNGDNIEDDIDGLTLDTGSSSGELIYNSNLGRWRIHHRGGL